MSSVSTFGAFTTARLGIYVSQKGLSVTGNNIANINTEGYTRQRLDQVSFKTGGSDLYQTSYDMRVGMGAIAKSVSQLRDPYLDIRYRTESSSVGYHNGRLQGLNQIASILDEIGRGENDGDGLLYGEFSKFADALRHLQTESGDQVNDTLVANSAKALSELFNSASTRLERLRTNTETQLRQEVDDINSILISIRKLNESIRDRELYGDKALELRDERNNLIDELSEKLKIDVTYSMVDIGLDKEVEKLTIRLGNANPDLDVKSDSSILVDGNYCAQLTTPKANEKFEEDYEVLDKTTLAYKDAVKGLKRQPPETVTVGGREYKTVEELKAASDAALADPNTVDKLFRYLDENGQGTNDPRVAQQEFDSGYNITVSDLRDKNGQAWIDYDPTRTVALTPAQTEGFPVRARYNGSFTIDGMWKKGDTISVTVDGTQYTVKIGKHPTAKEANEDPKNISNAIRDVLVASPAFRDADGKALYNINTATSKNSDGSYKVMLSIFKKEAGEVADPPVVNISSSIGPAGNEDYEATKGSITLGDMREEYTGSSPLKSWSCSVTSTKNWNIGDVISIKNGNTPAVSLVVGQDISVKSAGNPKTLATILGQKLRAEGYTVSSNTKGGDIKLVFTAQNAETDVPPELTAEVTAPKNASIVMDTANSTWNYNADGTAAGANGSFGTAPNPKVQDNGDNTISTEARVFYQDDSDNWYRASMTAHTSKTKVLDDNDLQGKLQAVRELLTEEGEFCSQDDINADESAAVRRGIPYYQHTLDLLARKFAETMNEANNGYAVDHKGNYLTKDGKTIELAGEPVNKTNGLTDGQKQALIRDGYTSKDGTPDLNAWLKSKEGSGEDSIWKMGGNLFSNRGDTDDATGITAANIAVSKSWSSGDVHVVTTYTKLFGGEISNTTQDKNALHMGNLVDRKMIYNPQDIQADALSTQLFEGSFQEVLEKMSTVLGNDQRTTGVALETHLNQALDIDTNRDSVSAVDLNDEAMDLMQYSHSLNAAYRLMTTLDDVLDRLITGTGVTR